MKKQEMQINHFEKARLVGARALQLAMGAPPLVKVPEGVTNPLKLAFMEFEKNAVPLSVARTAIVA